MATTLDVLSGGRLNLGVGSGSSEPEHHQMGIPWETLGYRSELLEDTLEIVTRMFTGTPTTYDGEHFQLLIFPVEYRALIVGSNVGSYREQRQRIENDPELAEAGPLLNMRPQHFTSALLPIPLDEETIAFAHEDLVVEPDRRPRAKKNAQIRKSYYVLDAVHRQLERAHAVGLPRDHVEDQHEEDRAGERRGAERDEHRAPVA